MKKRFLAFLSVVLMVAMLSSCSLFGKTLDEKDLIAFIEDSQDAISYFLSTDNSDTLDDTLNDDLAVRMAAASYVARNKDDLTCKDNTYTISAADLEAELTSIFPDCSATDFESNGFVSKDAKEDYVLKTFDWDEQSATYEITDTFYGYVGSEPTTMTVHYAFEDQNCYVDYTLAGDDNSPYTFIVTGMDIRE